MNEPTSGIIAMFLRFMLVVVWIVWAPIGFFLWIPLLFRATLLFAGLVVHAVITGENPTGLKTHLEAAIDFWFYGFRVARATVLQPDAAPRRRPSTKAHLVLVEILWATCVWLIAAWLFTPGLLRSLFREVAVIFGRGELWLPLAVLLAVLLFLLGRSVERGRSSARAESRT